MFTCPLSAIVEPLRILNPPITFSAATRPHDTLLLGRENATLVGLSGVAGDCAAGATLCSSPSGGSSTTYGYRCIAPIASHECPADTDLTKCTMARPGELCDGDGECGTLATLNNCRDRGMDDVYRASTPLRSHAMILTERRTQVIGARAPARTSALGPLGSARHRQTARVRTWLC